MLASVPPGEFFSHGARGVKSNLILTEEADRSLGFFELAPPYTRDVWTRVEKVVVRQILAPRLLELFHEQLLDKYCREIGEEVRDTITRFDYANIDGRIMRRLPGYRIKPHSDPRQSGVTCLIYLTQDDHHERFGTEIFRVETDEAPPFADKYYADHEQVPYRFVKMSPYRRNTMLAFVNDSRSLHGVTVDPASCAPDFVRLVYQFYMSPYVWQIEEAKRAAAARRSE